MIELLPDCYIVGFWYAQDPKTNNDWMCCVQRNPKNEKRYFGDYRFRYSKDERIWDSDDEKRWMSFSSKEDQTEESMIQTINKIQSHLGAMFKNKDVLLVQGGLEKFFELSKTKDWMHMKSVELNKENK